MTNVPMGDAAVEATSALAVRLYSFDDGLSIESCKLASLLERASCKRRLIGAEPENGVSASKRNKGEPCVGAREQVCGEASNRR